MNTKNAITNIALPRGESEESSVSRLRCNSRIRPCSNCLRECSTTYYIEMIKIKIRMKKTVASVQS